MNRSPEEFIDLLKPVYNNALQYCLALTKNGTEAKDLLQESLLKGIQGFRSLREEAKFKSWLFKIITREFYALSRKSVSRKHLLNGLKAETTEFPNVFSNEISDLKQKALLHAMKLLNEKERAAILLFEVGGFSLEEVRQIQGEHSLSAIKSRLSRTRSKLKELILSLQNEKQL
ncbi:MAG TPA: RNA polymerase sigma factor [Chitinophagaceae bacterium]|nr:RNA polymerase sigma factor [Chitinophagaceae bacterium]